MRDTGLSPYGLELLCSVFRRHPVVLKVVLYGSRAKGTHRHESDIDLALVGVDDDMEAEALAFELDELPLPYHFDVKAFGAIRHAPLREHIDRFGVVLYERQF
ncbi:MAG: hypothetical protein COW89_03705 [Nitrospinae bacterium CG22_combo_CG10-13_8_21_14_all_47_10]|nr:MAG: hypothetical protein COW89_03705 [Nitrospinae bacterium CG22_combo_CG10-13_8_21_14_all_47_10]